MVWSLNLCLWSHSKWSRSDCLNFGRIAQLGCRVTGKIMFWLFFPLLIILLLQPIVFYAGFDFIVYFSCLTISLSLSFYLNSWTGETKCVCLTLLHIVFHFIGKCRKILLFRIFIFSIFYKCVWPIVSYSTIP